jgi:multidrug resistance protein MdtO
MATAVLPATRRNSSLVWMRDFLREELSPYPGRGALVARMVIATTLITVIGMTFRIPYIYQGAIYVAGHGYLCSLSSDIRILRD